MGSLPRGGAQHQSATATTPGRIPVGSRPGQRSRRSIPFQRLGAAPWAALIAGFPADGPQAPILLILVVRQGLRATAYAGEVSAPAHSFP